MYLSQKSHIDVFERVKALKCKAIAKPYTADHFVEGEKLLKYKF